MSHAIRITYILAATGLGNAATVNHLDHGPAYITTVAGLAALLLITAVYREARCAEEHHPEHDQAQDTHDPAATQVQAWLHAVTELDAACCEHWWTSLGTSHTPTCPNTRKERR
jgi:hypothetical protein